MTNDERVARGWIPAAVGCHWQRGDYFVSTVSTGDGSRHGYRLTRNRRTLGEFITWDEVERLAERRQS